MLPREHGAYAQLLVPLATALALRWPTPSAVALAVGACFAFVATQPLRLALRRDGAEATRAARWLAVLASAAIVAGAVGLADAPAAARILIAIAAVPAVAAVAIMMRRTEHTIAGELVAAIALSGASAPVAVAAGTPWRSAAVMWGAWAIGYIATVLAVHGMIARAPKLRGRRRAIAIGVVIAASLVIAAVAVSRHAVPALPLVLVAVPIAVRPPPASRLRAVGVVLVIAAVAASALTLVTMVVP